MGSHLEIILLINVTKHLASVFHSLFGTALCILYFPLAQEFFFGMAAEQNRVCSKPLASLALFLMTFHCGN